MKHLIGIVALVLVLAGCRSGDYNTVMAPVTQDYYTGNTEGALLRATELVVDASDEDKPLFLMERGIINQRLRDFEASQKDLIAADEQLEVLDFTSDTSGTLLEYTTSADLTLYRGQPHEKILINTLNMINFLSEGQLTGARIEARRAGEMYDYQTEVEERYNYKNGLTMLLYGLTFEASGRPNDAYVAYRKAYELTNAPFLKSKLLHIARDINHSDASRWASEFGELQLLRGVHFQNMEGWPEYWMGLPPMAYIYHGLGPVLFLANRPVRSVPAAHYHPCRGRPLDHRDR